MSALLCMVGERPPAAPLVTRMLERMERRGSGDAVLTFESGALLALRRHDWEAGMAGASRAGVVRCGSISVIADASLYYRAELREALDAAGEPSASDDAGELIAAAYRAWAEDGVRKLEGDFAFVVWDAHRSRLVAARDFCGKRPLYYGEFEGGIIVASDPAAIALHPSVDRGWNAAALAEDAAAMTGSADETAYRGVKRVPPGARVVWDAASGARLERYWHPPVFRDAGRPTDGAEELRGLITRAVAERLDGAAATVVWLSGGWDSPAVFAASRRYAATRTEIPPALPLSVSYPTGDPGREDELIEAICAHWGERPRFLDSRRVPVLARAAAAAVARPEPFPHPFEVLNRTMSRETRALGARVVLDGGGGDQLFQVSSVYLADLFERFRWIRLAREWRARRAGVRRMFKLSIQPTLPDAALRLATFLRGGRALSDTSDERRPPAWIRADAVRELALLERERRHLEAPRQLSRAARESHLYLTLPLFGRMAQYLGEFALEEGLEHRSPLYDQRLVEFAAARPVHERRSFGETKRLLRRSMRGLLPDHVLAPRPYRTGVTIGYLVRGLRAKLGPWIDECLRDPVLADLGILEPAAARSAWHEFLRTGDRQTAVSLYITIETELWLRTHEGRPVQSRVVSDGGGESLLVGSAAP